MLILLNVGPLHSELTAHLRLPSRIMQSIHALRRLSRAALLLAALWPQPARAESKPTVSATVSTIQLQDRQNSIILVFKTDGLTKEQQLIAPEVETLLTSQGGPRLVNLVKPTKVADLESGAFWKVSAEVEGLPLNSSFDVPVLVHIGKIGEVLPFKITNILPPADADVSPGSDTIWLEKSRDTDFTVNVKTRALVGLSVCQSALADANTGNHLAEHFLGMYLESDGVAANPEMRNPYLTLSAPSTKVHLFISPEFHDKGVFAGTVGICSASKAAVATLKLTVNSSTCTARIAGALLIVIGIALYVLVTVVLKQRSRQLTALLPASRLVEALNGLQNSAKQVAQRAGVELPVLLGDETVAHSLQWLIAQLSVAKLKEAGFLPPLLTNPFQQPDTGADYQQFLQTISAQELNDAIIVRDGLERVMSLWPRLDEDSARSALTEIDKLALEADSTDPMRTEVDALVNAIAPRQPKLAEMLAAAHDNFRASGGTPPSVHEITVQLDLVSGIGWIIWALLTFLFGCAALILSNHGFGTWQDFLKCFLWGLGIQAAGQGLQALTPSSAVSTFSLQIGH